MSSSSVTTKFPTRRGVSPSAARNFCNFSDLKAYGWTSVRFSKGNAIEVKPLFSNALLPITESPPGAMVTVVRFIVSINASAPITVTLEGIETVMIDSFPLNALSAIAVTATPSYIAGIVTVYPLLLSPTAVDASNPVTVITPSTSSMTAPPGLSL